MKYTAAIPLQEGMDNDEIYKRNNRKGQKEIQENKEITKDLMIYLILKLNNPLI